MFAIGLVTAADAQTVKWSIKPSSSALSSYGSLIKHQKGGKIGLQKMDGSEVLPVVYDSITFFKNSYALALQYVGGRYLIKAIVREGDYDVTEVAEEIYATKYDFFSEGKLCVSNVSKMQGFLGTDGNLVIPCNYKYVHPFSEGLASVTLETKRGKQNVYYINSVMNEINVEPGNGEVIFGSTFSGGRAIVYTIQRNGYIINEKGREIQRYKPSVESAYASAKKSNDYTIEGIGAAVLKNGNNTKQDIGYEVISENGKYGYQYNGQVLLPAQLDEAGPFCGGYALVKMNGQDGMLRRIDGNFSGKFESGMLTVSHGRAAKAFYQLNIPADLSRQNITLKVYDENKKMIPYSFVSETETTRTFSIEPEVSERQQQKKYDIYVYSDGLLLWNNNVTLAFNHIREESDVKTEIKKPADFKITGLTRLRKRADENDNFPYSVTVRNYGDVNGIASVRLLVDGKSVAENKMSIKAGSSSKTTLSFKVTKERYAKVSVVLGNGKGMVLENEHLLPIY